MELETFLMYHNVFVSEAEFSVQTGVKKKYRAIYNAKMESFKRHHLAADVDSLALLYSPYGRGGTEYYRSVRNALPRATFINGSLLDRSYRLLTRSEVARLLNRSNVGLCLSEVEGGMVASMEYLLCGLPVVSTESRGGRQVFFDERYSRIVPPDSQMIAAAVAELISANIDPHQVRTAALGRVVHYRRRLIEFISKIQTDPAGYRPANASSSASGPANTSV